jgi:D-glycero-D-manno-heptose 1,7-bisphosphate phosphatase
MPSPTPAIFLDKDGTLIENLPYNVDPAQVRFTPGAIASLQKLAMHYPIFIVTNQSGIARGYFSAADLKLLEDHIRAELAQAGIPLQGFYACPHHPAGLIPAYSQPCRCRKPLPGLLEQAASEHDLDLSRSWLVGDILHDVQAGRSAGCRTILLNNGNETEWQLSPDRLPHHIVEHFWEVAQIILALTHPAYSAPESVYA